MQVVVLGAGFGGLELSTALAEEFGDELDVIADRQGCRIRLRVLEARRHVRQAGARATSSTPTPACTGRGCLRPGGDPVDRSGGTAGRDRRRGLRGRHPGRGARRRPPSRATPRACSRPGRSSTRWPVRSPCATSSPSFGGGRVVIGVTSTPFKCPPAPSETALLMHDHLVAAGLRDTSSISLVMPFGVPIPPSPDASAALLAAFAERGIDWHPERLVTGTRPRPPRWPCAATGARSAFDLFLGVPGPPGADGRARVGRWRSTGGSRSTR